MATKSGVEVLEVTSTPLILGASSKY